MPLTIMPGSGLPNFDQTMTIADQRASRAGHHGVGGNDADPQVAASEGRARVEPEPAERQDEGAGDGHRQVVARDGDRLAALGVLADAGAEDDRPGERGDAAHHVDDRRAGEVDVAVSEAEVRSERRQPPRPHTQLPKIG